MCKSYVKLFVPLKIVHIKNDTESYRKPLEAGDKTGDPQTQVCALIRRKHPEISNEKWMPEISEKKIYTNSKQKQTNKNPKTKNNGKLIVKQKEIDVVRKVYILGAK